MSKKQKKDKAACSTRQLMGIEEIKDYCIATRMGNLVFFIIKPTNISVLPDSSISARIYALLNVVKGQAEIEMLALNSKESFERNKDFYRERLSQEELPAVRRLLEQDSKHLDRIQVLMASSREFYIIIRLRGEQESDVFSYKDFSDAHIDTIEIMVSKLYAKWGITERSNFRRMRPEDYPILSDLYNLIEEEFKSYDPNAHLLYTEKLLQEVLLGLHSMCKGADAQFFNGHTNITSSRFLVFGVKGMLSAAKNVRNAMLFNVLSFMSDKLLTVGNTVAALDELYIWLSNPTAIEYIRNCLKRVRKKESAMLLASQNLEDFDQEHVREMTKPLFSIPPHQFLFNAGSIDKRSYMEMLQLDEAEYNLIKFPQRGVCLYKCGNERYLLEVHAPTYKERLFGTAGGR